MRSPLRRSDPSLGVPGLRSRLRTRRWCRHVGTARRCTGPRSSGYHEGTHDAIDVTTGRGADTQPDRPRNRPCDVSSATKPNINRFGSAVRRLVKVPRAGVPTYPAATYDARKAAAADVPLGRALDRGDRPPFAGRHDFHTRFLREIGEDTQEPPRVASMRRLFFHPYPSTRLASMRPRAGHLA